MDMVAVASSAFGRGFGHTWVVVTQGSDTGRTAEVLDLGLG